MASGSRDVLRAPRLASTNAHSPKGGIDVENGATRSIPTIRPTRPTNQIAGRRLSQRRPGPPRRCRRRHRFRRERPDAGPGQWQAGGHDDRVPATRANIIQMVDRVKALMPQLRASVSPAIDVNLAVDRSKTIRASLRDVEITLVLAVALVRSWCSRSAQRARHAGAGGGGLGIADRNIRGHVSPGIQPRHLLLDGASVATGFVVDRTPSWVLENITLIWTRACRGWMPRCWAPARSASRCCR